MAATRFHKTILTGANCLAVAILAFSAASVQGAEDRQASRDREMESKRQAEVQRRQEVEKREVQSRGQITVQPAFGQSVRTDSRSSQQAAPSHVTSPWAAPRTDTGAGSRNASSQRTQPPGYVSSPWGVTRTSNTTVQRDPETSRLREEIEKKRLDSQNRYENERRETYQRREEKSQPTTSPGYVTGPWAAPATATTSVRREDERSRLEDEKRRAEIEKRWEIERRERDDLRTSSPGYVTSPWAIPQIHTRLEDRYRDYDPPKRYRPPVCTGGRYYYPGTSIYYRPYHYGYWVWDDYGSHFCRKSVYFYYGFFPYVRVVRLYVRPYVVLEYRNVTVSSGNGYYLTRRGDYDLDEALSDIRTAWTSGRIDLIERHVRDDVKIAVLLDRKYDYSIDSEDYVDMTRDAMEQMETISFFWQSVKQRTDDAYTAFGQHVYRDSTGVRNTVYVSYTLEQIRGRYIITEVGSSRYSLLPM